MELRSSNARLGIATDAKEFGQTNRVPCKFEISQADSTFKLRRVNTNNSLKIKLKPFFGTNPPNDLKISLSGLLNNDQNQLKRPLDQVYDQKSNGVSASAKASKSKANSKIKKSKETTIKLRKCQTDSTQENKNELGSEEAQAQGSKVFGISVPISTSEDSFRTNGKRLYYPKGKAGENEPRIYVKAPEYIKKLYEKMASEDVEEYKNKFYASFKNDNQKIKKDSNDFPKLPVDFVLPPPENLRKDFIHDLEIITNDNRKEKIKVSFQPGKVEAFNEIPNMMDTQARDGFFSEFNFTMDYRSGYAPIDVQAKQEKEFTYKNHFIKKKQSCANNRLKRVCGVSYVKKLECHQLNVDNIFAKLNPLVFQGSTGCVRLTEHQALVKQATDKIFEEGSGHYFIVTLLEAEDESLMREYLYFPERRMKLTKGKVYLVKSLDSLWFFFKDKHFICVHFIYDDKEFVKKSEVSQISSKEIEEALRKSNIHLGFLCKRGLSGKKSFLKIFTEGLQGEGLDIDSDSDDEPHPQAPEENKEASKDKEQFASPKHKKKQEKKEIKEKEKQEKKEKKEQEKKEKQEKREKENQEKKEKKDQLIKLKSVEKEKKEPALTKKQLHFFDRCKQKLEHDHVFSSGIMSQVNSSVDEIMQPYLKMLFLKGYNCIPSQNNNNNINSLPTPSVISNDFGDQATVDQTPLHHDDNRFDAVSGLVTPRTTSNIDLISHEKLEEVVERKSPQETQMQTEPQKEEASPKTEAAVENNKKERMNVEEQKTQPEPSETTNNTMIDNSKHSPLHEFIRDVKKEPGKNMVTLSVRIELYTHEESWKTADEHTKNLLYTFILHLTDLMMEKFRNWTLKRTELVKNNSAVLYSDIHKEIDLYEFNPNDFDKHAENVPLDPVNLNWHFNPEIKNLDHLALVKPSPKPRKYFKNLKSVSLADLQGLSILQKEGTSLSLPLYVINTRDSFAFDLIEKSVEMEMCGRKVIKTDYYFDPVAVPSNFKTFLDKFPDYHVGVTTYNNFFTHEELLKIEEKCYETERRFFDNHFLPMTGQMTATNDKVRRTKFFFGARYMWTKQQLSEPHSMVGAGIRTDVSDRPKWTKDLVENPMVEAGIMEKDFVNSIAMNVYHDGKEGIAQHFDDAVRFKQPIFSLRIFSDSRLSFGSQFYGFCNGAFCIPMPRGCITVLAEESYSANGIKHCVRPCDMTGKSAALILRQMHHKVFNEAQQYNEFVDFPTWFSTLSIKDNAVSYSDQKRIEADNLLKNKKKEE